MTEWTIVRDC